jgi:nucleoside-diphosphate-sugar epimerase
MRVFITGGSGFVGRHLLQYLAAVPGLELALLVSQPQVFPFLPTPPRQIIGRLETLPAWQAELRDWAPQICIHLAWYAEPGKYLYAPQNTALLGQSLALLEVLIEAGCRSVLMAGSVAEYDTDRGYLREDSPTAPQTIYATAKLALSWMGARLAADAGISFTWARLFYLYGPGEDERRVLPALVRALVRGEAFASTPGQQIRDYLHVADVAAALWHLAAGQHGGVYNICSGYPVQMGDFLRLAARQMGREDLLQLGALPYRQWEPMFICGDNQKLRGTGWQARYSLEAGLGATIGWWKEHLA